jgi:hypothetical protein
MAFQLSPNVEVKEVDLTTIVPGVATSDCAFCGPFMWGPCGEITLIDSENTLYDTFGPPANPAQNDAGNAYQAEDWLAAASFLAYGNKLHVVRSVDVSAAKNAVANDGVAPTAQYIGNADSYASTSITDAKWLAKYPGTLGSSLKVSLCSNALSFAAANATNWAWASKFDRAPGTTTFTTNKGGSGDEIHVIVVDEDGGWTGTANTVLEVFPALSLASDAKKTDGSTNYYKNVINTQSKYIWWGGHPTNASNWGDAANGTTYGANVETYSLVGGTDGQSNTSGGILGRKAGYTLFADKETSDISLVMMGNSDTATTQHVIDNVALVRKDCVVFYSPDKAHTVNVTSQSVQTTNCKTKRNTDVNRSTSYAVMDSGHKMMYDRYNDLNRPVPLNGDIAGLCARTDDTNDPWWSPAGFNRGQLKNVVKLYFNPRKAYRDELYKNGINPVVSFPGDGPMLYGDKTTLNKPSAFDRINVRRLFIVLEKAIERAAKYSLFEFNDEFTRANFRNLIEPYLTDVKGRRGIYDFKVVCDESNNTGEVIDRNEFIGDIFIKPARSINFITLNFIAARTGVDFSEIGG